MMTGNDQRPEREQKLCQLNCLHVDEEGKPEEPPNSRFSSPFLSLGLLCGLESDTPSVIVLSQMGLVSLCSRTRITKLGFKLFFSISTVLKSAINRSLFKAIIVCELYREPGARLGPQLVC